MPALRGLVHKKAARASRTVCDDRQARIVLREIADRALSRAAGAPLVRNNHARILKDARENYPAWLQAINAARGHVYFESYIIYEDDIGEDFAQALIARARDGVRVRLIYDWLGALGKASRRFWANLSAGGVEVRCYNPPRFDSPLGWLSRDHRKMLAVDGEAAFVSGLCVGRAWVGDPRRKLGPWRDTGIEVRGPAVAEIEQAFAEIWAMMGDPIPAQELSAARAAPPAGCMDMRIVASQPATAGMLRTDQLVAALARTRLWLSDAYFAGSASYVQALRAAANDGVDVRLLVPNSSDIPILTPLSRAGYRTLLEAGVRIFEWNGTMMHAKTALADDHWARVGSTNLNVASWLGNCELDAIIEDEAFAREMERMYLEDLANATEIVLDCNRIKPPARSGRLHPASPGGRGSTGRAAAGALRVGNAIGAAFTNRRVLQPVEDRILMAAGLVLLALAIFFGFFPRVPAYLLGTFLAWTSAAMLYRALRLRRADAKKTKQLKPEAI